LTDTVVQPDETRTMAVNLRGADTLTVAASGRLAVVGAGPAVSAERLSGGGTDDNTAGITNFGVITSDIDAAAIRVGESLHITNAAGAVIRSDSLAIRPTNVLTGFVGELTLVNAGIVRAQNAVVAMGSINANGPHLTVENTGSILSTTGNALEVTKAGATITNSGNGRIEGGASNAMSDLASAIYSVANDFTVINRDNA